MSSPPSISQISISLSLEKNAIAPASAVHPQRCERERKLLLEDVLRRNGGPMTFNLQDRMPPFNICISNRFAEHVRRLHGALDKALVDIVSRWYSDEEASFPTRMPFEKHEEVLLEWIYGRGAEFVAPFAERYGMWRTDYLIEKTANGQEQAKICEINSRIPYNGFWVVGYHEEATKLLRGADDKLRSPNDFKSTRRAIIDCFDATKPLYHVREKWPGCDSHPFLRAFEQETGMQSMTVTPSQLQVQPNAQSPTGHSLFVSAENEHIESENCAIPQRADLQEVSQCSLELFQEELADIDPVVLQQIATCCVNDFRNILIVHDKRILSIIRDELPDLVAREVLTEEERQLLENRIIETLLPGSSAMKILLQQAKQDDGLRYVYIAKPVRDASCHDIRLGKNMTQEEWLGLLERLSNHALLPSEGAYVVQRLVNHVWYGIATHDEGGLTPEKYHMIGSHHMINSKFDAFGPWRLGKDVHVGFKEGTKKGIVVSSVLRPERMAGIKGREE